MGNAQMLAPNPWMIVPFGLLLAAVALGPLVATGWWHRHYPKVACSLGAITLAYYLFGLHAGGRVLHVAHEYVSFIALIGSLYVVAGGIHLRVQGEATPAVNTAFLLVGALIANLLGTTGASMLLIRPWLRMNRYRLTAHHVVFFIFVVANVGGCLTPIGDPPLFLGYLKGIPFWWVAQHCWPMWAVGVGSLLAVFFVLDCRNYRRSPAAVRAKLAEPADVLYLDGLPNLVFLGVIIIAVFVRHPAFLREGLMVGAAAGSWFLTRKPIHAANHFTFEPIREVAILFLGIFATMLPALDWLEANARSLGNPTPGLYYWACGGLSSVLDNAPTYLSFLSATFGSFVDAHIVQQVQHLIQTGGADLAALTGSQPEAVRQTFLALQKYHAAGMAAGSVSTDQLEIAFLLGNPNYNRYLLAISVGAVFFGAFTYIGNGPNFMVKSIADHQHAHAPTFLGYIGRFAVPFLLPTLLVVWWLFFRH
jgi:Na+/H+ antiporter NhaD/arsenite permease-like protein